MVGYKARVINPCNFLLDGDSSPFTTVVVLKHVERVQIRKQKPKTSNCYFILVAIISKPMALEFCMYSTIGKN